MELNKRNLDNFITGHYGEDQFRDTPEDELEGIELHPEILRRIEDVSKAWNAMIYKSGRDEIDRRIKGDTGYSNRIVSALQKDGELNDLSDALQKLFALQWECETK